MGKTYVREDPPRGFRYPGLTVYYTVVEVSWDLIRYWGEAEVDRLVAAYYLCFPALPYQRGAVAFSPASDRPR
jgi:hypothetical protein